MLTRRYLMFNPYMLFTSSYYFSVIVNKKIHHFEIQNSPWNRYSSILPELLYTELSNEFKIHNIKLRDKNNNLIDKRTTILEVKDKKIKVIYLNISNKEKFEFLIESTNFKYDYLNKFCLLLECK